MGGDLSLYMPDTAWSTSNTIQDHIQHYMFNTKFDWARQAQPNVVQCLVCLYFVFCNLAMFFTINSIAIFILEIFCLFISLT
jgi:hypothetical protein